MSYKFQRGEAFLSGSVIIPSDNFEAKGLLSSDQISGSGNLSIGGTVRLDGVADAALDVTADSFYYLDGDNLMKSDSMADYATAIAGDGLAASNGALSVGVDNSGIEINTDALRLKDNGVTLAKMAGLARGKFILGDSSGDPSALALGSSGQILISDGTDLAYASFSGDVAIAANGATTIQDGAVESDMLNNNIISGQAALGAASVAQADLLMIDDGPGTVKKVTFSNFEDSIFDNVSSDATIAAGGALTIADNAVTLAKMAGLTRGSIILGDASGDPSALAKGTAAQFLQSDGTDPSYVSISGDATIAAGGALTIAANAVEDSMVNDNVAAGLAGDGLSAASGIMAVAVSGAVKIASDKVGITGSFAGNGLTAVGGDDSISSMTLNADPSSFNVGVDGLTLANGVAGAGIDLGLGILSVNVDDSGIEINTDTLRLKDNGVTLAKLAGITRGSIILGDSSGDPSLLAKGTAAQFLQSDGTDPSYVSISGDATIAAGGALTIAADAVEPSMMNIFDDSLAATNTHFMIADGTDYSSFALSGDVTCTNAGVVTIAAQAVENSMLADDAVGADELAANAVVEASIVDNSVTLAKMAGLARGKFIYGDASGDPAALTVGTAHQFLQADGTDLAWISMSGDATLAAGVLSIGATKVTDAMINDDVAAGLAGAGLTATSGVLSVTGNNVALKAAGGTLAEGYNYFADASSDAAVSLPAAPSVGDIVVAKAGDLTSGAKITINRQGSHTIDGETSIIIESPFGAVTMVYVVANNWRIV